MLNKEEELKLKKIIYNEDRFFFILFCFIFIIFSFFGFSLFYIFNTQLNILAETRGVVIPSTKVKTIQHLEGGIIKKIFVKTGDIVNKNDLLIELEPTKSLADFSELEKRLISLEINIIRLRAESDFKNLNYNNKLKNRYPKLIKDSKKLYIARKNKFNSLLEEQERILFNEKNTLSLLEEQIIISKSLLEEQLTNRLTHLNLLKEKNKIIVNIEKARSQIKNIKENFITDTRTALMEKKAEFDELKERELRLKDNLNRTLIKAPEKGIIKQRFIDTIGGVIQEGQELFEIVPVDDRLIIRSKLSVDQIGYVKNKQEVVVKLDGKNNSVFQPLAGKVINISPDAIYANADDEPFYEIQIETNKNYFENDGEKFFMYPGTQVISLIKIGKRTIADYLFEPIFSKLSIAFTEK